LFAATLGPGRGSQKKWRINMSVQAASPPEHEIRIGSISAAIWCNEVTEGDTTRNQYSVRIQKSYFDNKTNEWKTTPYFFLNDLPRLAVVAIKAYLYILLKPQSEAQEGERPF